jgi:hypothetical protein
MTTAIANMIPPNCPGVSFAILWLLMLNS